jgi:type I restriction enzyme M protein
MQPLGKTGLDRLEAEVKRLDPQGRFVTLNVRTREVSYSDEIRQHEAIVWTEGEEEAVRAYLVCWLCTVGGYLPANLELEKRYSIGRPKVGAQLDILVNRPDGTPFALVEAKSPDAWGVEADKYIEGQLFNIAPHEPGVSVLSFATVELASSITPKATTIAYEGQKFAEWQDKRSSSDHLPANYGEPIHEHYTAQGPRDLQQSASQAELDRLRKRLHDVLWRGSTPDNQIYEYVVKLFLTKIFDEKDTAVGQRYQFQRFYTGSSPETSAELFERISTRYQQAFNRYLNASGREAPEPLNTSVFSAEQTAFVVELLQGLSLTSTDERGGDLLGGFFEGITRDGFKQSKGLFFTHLNLAVFMLLVLDVPALALEKIASSALYSERLPYIIDPACGSGTFLLAAMHLITAAVHDNRGRIARTSDISEFLDQKFPEGHPNAWAADFIFGIDQSELLAMSTKVNMVLHRDGNTHVYKADGLAPLSRYTDQRLKPQAHTRSAIYSKPVAESFDIVISNPPFSITVDPATLDIADSTFELARGTNSENLFLERWYQLLKPGGRLAAVLPESFFATRENLAARLFLLDHFRIVAIVSMPRQAFEPWTPTRTSLLFAEKRRPDEETAWGAAKVPAEKEVSSADAALRKALSGLRSITRNVSSEAFGDRLSAVDESWNVVSLASLDHLVSQLDERISELNVSDPDSSVKDQLKSLRRTRTQIQKLSDRRDIHIAEAASAAEVLAIDLPVLNTDLALEDLDDALGRWETEARGVDVSVRALRRIVGSFEYDFPVLNVEDIGYKRTKRTEYSRRNSLFTIRSFVDGSIVSNLNLVEGRWSVAKDEQNADTALAQLRAVIKWR